MSRYVGSHVRRVYRSETRRRKPEISHCRNISRCVQLGYSSAYLCSRPWRLERLSARILRTVGFTVLTDEDVGQLDVPMKLNGGETQIPQRID